MSSVLDGVDQRTQLVGQNRLELLLFKLSGRQRYGINVFKVQEVIHCPSLTALPHSNPVVRGIANMRGRTIPVMDLAMAIGKRPLESTENCFVIITEYNRSVQGFLVDSVERIVNMNWEEILPPPRGVGKGNFLTAVTRVDEELVEIIDVEKVLSEIVGVETDVSEELREETDEESPVRILIVDDSSVARNQVKRTCEQLGMTTMLASNGKEGLDELLELVSDGADIRDKLDLVISDVEMPEMDGYTLTTEIRRHERLKNIPVMLHTSLSGVFNEDMVKKVGADKFVPKFNADELARMVRETLDEHPR
ncbi:MAG TPA: chemotaxis signal transduction protein CheV [Gammaproteobacteria bacterium]|nr:chemotaxis signal transduction protein CheV [Gammaproteobacteria bacterium]